jgi:hypothetical protein
MEKTRIVDYIYLRTGCLFSRFQLAALDLGDLRLALGMETDGLLEYMQDKRDCWAFKIEANSEMKQAGILTVTMEERRHLECFSDVVFFAGKAAHNSLDWMTDPISLVNDTKGLISGALLLTASE